MLSCLDYYVPQYVLNGLSKIIGYTLASSMLLGEVMIVGLILFGFHLWDKRDS
jgi:hypothetical protein